MDIILKPVSPELRQTAEGLKVAPFQRDFIESVPQCMAEADEIPDWEPLLIYQGETPVGFAMYGLMRSEPSHRLWFDRLLIDARYQGRGLGRKAVEAILKRLRLEFPGTDIYLSAYEDNEPAIGLYRSFGFHFNGELDYNGEKIMILEH